jgi:SPP1 family predicted phage head-tail adaptor
MGIRFTDPIEIQSPVRTQNDTGEYEITSWIRFAFDYATFRPIGGKESVQAAQPKLQAGYLVEMRWRPDLKSDMRIKRLTDNAIYQIADIRNEGPRGGRITLLCQTKSP